MNYKIITEGGTWVKVTGRPVRIKGFGDFKFFYWKENDGRFSITEVATGRRVCSAYTLTKAREIATRGLTVMGKETFKKVIEEVCNNG